MAPHTNGRKSMNYLGLVNRTMQECGIPGSELTTTANQVTEKKRFVDWVAQAWLEIQLGIEDWQFLRSDFEFDTVADQQSYDVESDVLLTDFANWKDNSFRIYLKASTRSAESFLSQWLYNEFRDVYMFGTNATATAQPSVISIAPDKALLFGLLPNDVYTVRGEYYMTPQELSDDADIPLMPTRFHMAIVYKAMMSYGVFEAATEVYQRGDTLYNTFINKLKADQAPGIIIGAPLI